jgi:dipeptidyl aminopeptidase/acylaminoacyl peptidase
MTYVTKDAAPILIMQGTADPLVPMDQSKMLDAALKKAGADSTLVLIEGAGHGTGGFGKAETLLAVAAFFDKHLGVGPTTKGQ